MCLAKCLGEGEALESLPGLGTPCPVLQNTKFQVSQSSMCMAVNILDVMTNTRAGSGSLDKVFMAITVLIQIST